MFQHYKQQILVIFVSIINPLWLREETAVIVLISSYGIIQISDVFQSVCL